VIRTKKCLIHFKVNPFVLEQISHLPLGFEPSSKSLDVFAGKHLDFIITVCGNAAQEIFPCFTGVPKHIHWGKPDPAAVTGVDKDKCQAFSECFNVFHARVTQLISQIIRTEKTDSNHISNLMSELADN